MANYNTSPEARAKYRASMAKLMPARNTGPAPMPGDAGWANAPDGVNRIEKLPDGREISTLIGSVSPGTNWKQLINGGGLSNGIPERLPSPPQSRDPSPIDTQEGESFWKPREQSGGLHDFAAQLVNKYSVPPEVSLARQQAKKSYGR